MVEPNREDMERAKIALDDTLSYELDMLDAAARYMQTDEFSRLTKPKTEIEWLTRNATIGPFGRTPAASWSSSAAGRTKILPRALPRQWILPKASTLLPKWRSYGGREGSPKQSTNRSATSSFAGRLSSSRSSALPKWFESSPSSTRKWGTLSAR
jgi:hypothetical protein